MPAAGEQKWTINEALKYRQELATLYGANGSREQIRQYFVSDKKLGWDEGFEYTLQKYETRAAKTANKISQETYKNKHGIVEKREDLIRRKVEKDIGRAESVNTQLVQLGRYLECMSTGATFIPGPIKKFDSAIRK